MDEESEEQLLKILSNPIRATIIRKLYNDSLSFTHLMQITGCKTGQLSFHLKKLEYLVEQDELKRYKLSEKGKEDVEIILPRLSKNNAEDSEDRPDVYFAFMMLLESLIFFINSCISELKYIFVHSWKCVIGICSGVNLYVTNLVNNSRIRLKQPNLSWYQTSLRSFTNGLGRIIDTIVNSIKSIIIVIIEAIRQWINPLFSYSFMVVGLMLFIPAVFISVSPGFDLLFNSADNANRIIQFIDDTVFAAFSISLVMMLIGGLVTSEKRMLLKRFLLSTISASMLLIVVSVILLIDINTKIYQSYEVISFISNLLRNIIILLLLITFSTTGTFVYVQKMKSDWLIQTDD
ncbi:winged helix-turn-helix domain-containing protein [Methanolobus vulcani]|uniref:Winged helix-turn-helix transcriptional regulator n=1 Tax=Methanolobus vulcani TaxID=38026 RepID=A0A7Z8P2D0_9EURY|nr:winged helix-turn-helix domain-containing protein [Methanolobus vulcani]TQD25871.1 winged helix-turn-helix transcriptional regulator [Methanolobus vulcani]